MNYLRKFDFTEENIQTLKEVYNENIIEFISQNEIFITETINYLYSENIRCIYLLMRNNIKLFLETKIALKNKIDSFKLKGYNYKSIAMLLLSENNFGDIRYD